jgi:predicted secreted protein
VFAVRKAELMLLAVLAALAAATPDAAPAAAAPAQAAAPAAPKAKEEMICKSEAVTGSRFPKKVCYSKSEYEAKQRLDQEQLRQNQSGGLFRR